MFCDPEKLRDAILPSDSTIKEGMESLNKSSLGIILIIKDNLFIGTVTDGDIRRALVGGLSLEDSIEKVINKNAKVIKVNDGESYEEIVNKAKNLMKRYGIREVPILGNGNKIIDIITWKDISLKEKEDIYPPLSNIAFILAGGLGTRLDPFTKILPKPMIPVGDTPILELIIKKIYKYGFREFILSVNYKKEIIKNYFETNEFKDNDMNISFVEEKKRLGTAGSLALIDKRVEDTILVLNGDVILDTDYRKALSYHKRNKNHITIFAVPQSIKIPYGVLELDGGHLKNMKEKPEINVLINAGVYYIEPEVLEVIPKDEYVDMPEVFEIAKNKGLRVSAYPVYGNYFDIGQWEEYRKTLKYFENLT